MMQPRRLVVLMTGVSPDDLSTGASPWLDTYFRGAGRVTKLLTACGRPAADQIIDHLPAGVIRDLGMEVDQRSIVLRGRGQSDDAIMRQLSHRSSGPADLTILWLRDHMRSAIEFGLGSHQHSDALGQLERYVQIAYEELQSAGRPVQLTLLTADALQAVGQTFDPVHLLSQGLSHKLRQRCVIRRRLSHLQVESSSTRDTHSIERLLKGSAFGRYGRILEGAEKIAQDIPFRPGLITFLPHDGVAFAAHRVQAAPQFLSRDDGAAVLPWLTATRAVSDLAEVGQSIVDQLTASEAPSADLAPELPEVMESADLTTLTLPLDLSRIAAMVAEPPQAL